MASPNQVYDDEKTESEIGSVLRGHEAKKNPSPDTSSDEKDSAPTNSALSPAALKEAESTTTQPTPNSSGEDQNSTPGFSYKPTTKNVQKIAALGKKKMAAFGGAGVFIIILLILLMVAGSLKIPNLQQHIVGWQFTRTIRIIRQSTSSVQAEKFAMDTVDDSVYGSMRNKYSSLRESTWGKLDQYRPQKVVENLESTGQLEYVYGEPKGLLGRQQLEAIVINGEKIDVTQPNRLLHPIENYRGKLRIAGELEAATGDALKDNNSWVRGKAAGIIRDKIGLKKLRWWEKKGSTFNNASQEKAELLDARQSYQDVNSDGPDVTSSDENIAEAAREASDAQNKCVADDTCFKTVVADAKKGLGETPGDAVETAERVIEGNTIGKIASQISTVSQVAQPFCIIYDGSLEKSAPHIDAQNARYQKIFYSVSSAADQQKAGDTTSAAIGAFNGRLGDISGSVPEQRAAGLVPDASEVTPQTSVTGSSTLFNALFGTNVATSTLNGISNTICPKLNSTKGQIALAGIEVALFAVPGFGEASGGIKATLQQFIKEVSVKKIVTRVALEVGAVTTATLLAKYYVLNSIGGESNGLAQGSKLADQADAGGNLHAGEVNREYAYARPLTNVEVAQSNQSDTRFIAQENSRKSLGDRYFNINNSRSFASLSILHFSRFASSISMSISTLLKLPATSLNPHGLLTLFGGRSLVFAEDVTTQSGYGSVQWGMSDEEMGLVQNDPSYSPLENDATLETSGLKQKIADEYQECFTETQGKLLSEGKVQKNSDGSVKEDVGKCSPKELGPHNSKYGSLVFRWRIQHMYNSSVDEQLGIQNPTDDQQAAASPSSTASTGITGDIYQSSVDVPCAAGTNDVGVTDGYTNGQPVKIKLCALPNLASSGEESTPGSRFYVTGANGQAVVNSRVSGAVLAMVNAAKAAGITISAESTFRTMAHQQALCGGTCDGSTVAKPGYSNHQMGLAIDFSGTHVLGSSSSGCSGRAKDPTSAVWSWLYKNAEQFGYKQYTKESWHWDPMVSDNRCGASQ